MTTRYYRRRDPSLWDELLALGAGLAAGAAVAWIVRTWLRREALPPPPTDSGVGEGERREP